MWKQKLENEMIIHFVNSMVCLLPLFINEWALIEIFDINSSANITIWKQAFPSMIKRQSRTWWNSLFSVEKQINHKNNW